MDEKPGDRASRCGGLMRPVGIARHSKKGFQIIHRCEKCGVVRVNKIAEHTQMPDDLFLILRLMSETI